MDRVPEQREDRGGTCWSADREDGMSTEARGEGLLELAKSPLRGQVRGRTKGKPSTPRPERRPGGALGTQAGAQTLPHGHTNTVSGA